ncbi:protein-ER retention protein [Rhizoclosmatium sp. JEL0117]|nr:protein-ER retention protein [Rhizoclosmatium sp. JEL0117]
MHSHYSSQALSLIPANLYMIAISYSAITLASIGLFALVVWISGGSEEQAEYVPLLAYVLMLGLLVGLKADVFFGKERRWFLNSLKRIAFGTFASAVPFCDVIFADILTSFSKVLGDLHLVAQDLLSHESTHDSRYKQHQRRDGTSGGSMFRLGGRTMEIIGVALVCLPFLFRLRQCLAEYFQTQNNPAAQTRHLMNALKYCSAFPVIASSWFINWVRAEMSTLVHLKSEEVVTHSKLLGSMIINPEENNKLDEKKIEFVLNFAIGIWYIPFYFMGSFVVNLCIQIRIFFSLINSTYSLYWDIWMDWHLGTWSRKPNSNNASPAIRRVNSIPSRVPMIQLNPQQSKSIETGSLSSNKNESALDSSNDQDLPHPVTSNQAPFPFFLRKTLHFRSPWLYYAAIVFNTLLRMSWIVRVAILHSLLKQSVSKESNVDSLRGVLLGVDLGLKGLEVLRRWVWVFFRVEREWVGGKERGIVREVKG